MGMKGSKSKRMRNNSFTGNIQSAASEGPLECVQEDQRITSARDPPTRNIIFQALKNQIRITENAPQKLCEAFIYSFGAMHLTFEFLWEDEKVKWQQVNTWWYNIGVSRLQPALEITTIFSYKQVAFLGVKNDTMLMYNVARGETKEFALTGLACVSDADRFVQTPANNIYLLKENSIFKLLTKPDPSLPYGQFSTLERKQALYFHQNPVVCTFGLDNVVVSGCIPQGGASSDMSKSTHCSMFVPRANEWLQLPCFNTDRQYYSMCQVARTHVWVFGGSRLNGNMILNSVERLAIRAIPNGVLFKSDDLWETIDFPKTYLLPSLLNAKMLQVSNQELCIFAAGVSVSIDFRSFDIYNTKFKPGMRADFWQTPAVLSNNGTIVTADMHQKKILTFQKEKGVVLGCSL